MNIVKLLNIALFVLVMISCGDKYDLTPRKNNNPGGNTPGQEEVENPYEGIEKVPTLLGDKTKWTIDTITSGLIYYNYEAYDQVSKAPQIINVLEIDLSNSDLEIDFKYYSAGTIPSNVGNVNKAFGVINGTYERDASYIRESGINHSRISIDETNLRWWKHEGAIYSDGKYEIGFIFKGGDGTLAKQAYEASPAKDLFSSAPMLIDDFNPVGETFVGTGYTMEYLLSLDYENKLRHQGVRHPRTATALTADKDLLFFTVDGRWPGKSEGMNAAELTGFLKVNFNPQFALNMDGGGSTAMYVAGHGDPKTHIVNYPTDNGIFDHAGERKVSSFIIVKKRGK